MKLEAVFVYPHTQICEVRIFAALQVNLLVSSPLLVVMRGMLSGSSQAVLNELHRMDRFLLFFKWSKKLNGEDFLT